MRFLSNILSTIIGIFLFFFISFFFILIIGAIAGSGDGKPKLKKNSVIELDLSEISLDYNGKFEPSPFEALFDQGKKASVIEVIDAIEAAKTDKDIKGISILKNNSSLGLAQSKAIRNKLDEFKKSGKFVYAYSDVLSQKDYYLNSVADQVYLNPVGELDFKGLASEVIYMKDLQEKSGVKFEVIRHGKYKSAVEPFLAQEMSPENREQLTVLLQSVWQTVVTDISKSRNIDVATLNTIADNLGARTPILALETKLIDKIGYEDEYHDLIRSKLKVKKDQEYESISISDYASLADSPSTNFTADHTIAVIYAQGEIQGGEGSVNVIGEGSINRSLKEAREDDDVKAIVLRIDSPGGSALTSELIWREIELTKKVKPVVVSMGNVAASGGYYIACNSDYIFAEPNTITGSIGVFGMLPNMNELGKNIGINAEQVKTHKNASGYSVFEPLDEGFKAVVLESIEDVYGTFLQRVADGRKMTTEQVDTIAQGRVWTGTDALKNGLVDKLGSLDDAIKYAATLAKVKEYRTENYPEYESSFEDLLASMSGISIFKTKESLLKEQLGTEGYMLLEKIKRAQNIKGVQAMMPYELDIK
ncbi:signal peptide peptidase SppA [uncultured Flavobacterium sp.]|uniref:signal peptide peptidase SppA n=1 Tax=uncultured Flavobacterium sp. TaxID=165435 RepID=UPI0030EDB7A9|tara:strand:+ start:57495 stop:59267 length:1773 start_codon:yes stop_codon:yes gene_type:complete